MRFALVLAFFAVAWVGAAADFNWNLPPGFPKPVVPASNPMSAAKVELGRYLFYDARLSFNGRESCSTCHKQSLAFTDGRAHAEGTTGQLHPRSSMSLVNVAYATSLTWGNPALTSLEEQALGPMLNDEPVELGLKGHEAALVDQLRQEPVYRRLFPRAFPGEADLFTLTNVTKALAAFERTIISMRSPYDRYRWGGDMRAISDSAKRGELVYSSSERGRCFHCHDGWNFSSVRFEGGSDSPGMRVGKFRAPTLRNIAVTAPYMHDGGLATLEDAIDHDAAGGKPLNLSDGNRKDLVEFLKSLTDEELLRDSRWSDPWVRR